MTKILNTDNSGTLLLNKVENEYHELPAIDYPQKHIITPVKKPFFEQGFLVNHISVDGVESTLTKGVHFVFSKMYATASISSNLKVYEEIILLDPTLTGQVKIVSYQSYNNLDEISLIDSISDSRKLVAGVINTNVDYANISNKPYKFQPSDHIPDITEFTGFDTTKNILTGINIANNVNVNMQMPLIGSKSLVNGDLNLQNRIPVYSRAEAGSTTIGSNDIITGYTAGTIGKGVYQKSGKGHVTVQRAAELINDTKQAIENLYTQKDNLVSNKIGQVYRTKSTLGNNYLLCDGSTKVATDYPELSSTIGLDKIYSYPSVANLPIAMSSHQATTLPDGRVFICGGNNGSNYLNTAYIYNPTTNTYTSVANLPSVITWHAITTLNDGRVYICGGYNNSYLNTAYIYNPTTNTYTTVANLPIAMSYHQATTLPDGRVFICGGYTGITLANAYIYNPTTNTYTTVANLPIAMYYHQATTLPDGRVFICGGYNGSGNYLNTAYIYNPTTNTYTSVANLPIAMSYHQATTLPDGRVFICGGLSSSSSRLNTAYIYNPTSNTYTTVANLPIAMYGHQATTLPDGRVYICGGKTSINSLNTAYITSLINGTTFTVPVIDKYADENVYVFAKK